MKKNYFMLAAAALMFAACAETDFVNPVHVNEGEVIGFETFANLPTKANPENSTATDVNDLSTHHGSFIVWGYKNVATDYVFDGVVITHNGTAWNYEDASDKKYWDKAATSYEFYAAAPNIAGWELQEETAAQDDNYFTIDNVELKDETLASTSFVESLAGLTSNKDLMIANPNNVVKAKFGENVQFEFYHILSRLNITVQKKSTLTDDVVLTSISVKDLLNIANFDESKTAITTDGSTERWTKTANKGNLTGNALAEVTDSPKHVLQSLVIPQNVAYQEVNRDGSTVETAPYLYIEYTINGEPFNATYNLANAFGLNAVGNIPFNEGWQNNLNITIDAAEIKFAANAFVWKSSDKGFGIE
ncbi:MAG: fimbrillin family protein [Bacteroidales bacterium]|nr:fimbrillin family protein [Bacteroidales bacterium]